MRAERAAAECEESVVSERGHARAGLQHLSHVHLGHNHLRRVRVRLRACACPCLRPCPCPCLRPCACARLGEHLAPGADDQRVPERSPLACARGDADTRKSKDEPTQNQIPESVVLFLLPLTSPSIARQRSAAHRTRVRAALRGCEDETPGLDCARAQERVPVGLSGDAREGGGHAQEHGALLRQRAVQVREPHVVANRHPQRAPGRGRDHRLAAGPNLTTQEGNIRA